MIIKYYIYRGRENKISYKNLNVFLNIKQNIIK